jgi:hypothetical protein
MYERWATRTTDRAVTSTRPKTPISAEKQAVNDCAIKNCGTPLYAFDVLAIDGDDLRDLPLSLRKTNLARLLRGRPDGMFIAPFEQGEIGPDLFRPANLVLKDLSRNGLIGVIVAAARRTG